MQFTAFALSFGSHQLPTHLDNKTSIASQSLNYVEHGIHSNKGLKFVVSIQGLA